MLAQTVTGAPTGMPTTIDGAFILVAVTVVGLTVWLVRHILTNTIPALLNTFSTESQNQRASCHLEAKENRDLFDRRQEALLTTFSKEQEIARSEAHERMDRMMLHVTEFKTAMMERFDRTDSKIKSVHAKIAGGPAND